MYLYKSSAANLLQIAQAADWMTAAHAMNETYPAVIQRNFLQSPANRSDITNEAKNKRLTKTAA